MTNWDLLAIVVGCAVSLIALVVGAAVTFFVSRHYYKAAERDLWEAAKALRREALTALRDLKEAADGLAKETRHIRQILVGNTPVTYPNDPKTGS